MKSMLLSLIGTAFSGAILFPSQLAAQERIEDKKVVQYTVLLGINASLQKDAPFKVAVDSFKSSGMHKDEQVAVLIPDLGLAEDRLSKVTDKEVTPFGQLWLLNLVPQVEGKSVPSDKLRTITLTVGDDKIDAELYFLGLQKNSKGETELLVYGKGKEIAARPVLESHAEELSKPVLVDLATPEGKPMVVSVLLFGKHRAQIEVAGPKK